MRMLLLSLLVLLAFGTSLCAAAALYDEQAGLTFSSNTRHIAYNVTAIAQADNGTGPAYLINGLTDKGYWYQIGLTYNWPTSSGSHYNGFAVGYDIWGPDKKLADPSSGGIMDFKGTVNPGDTVLLSMYFNGSSITMTARDWNTGAHAGMQYSSKGAGHFLANGTTASNSNGFFTGLMTEWYHYYRYNKEITKVTYSPNGNATRSGWMWLDEFHCSDGSNCTSKTEIASNYSGYAITPNPYYFAKYFGMTLGFYENGTFFTGSNSNEVSISGFTASPMVTDVGASKPASFNVNVAGGSPPYLYTIYVDGNLYSKFSSQSYYYDGAVNTAGLSVGNHSYYVSIADSKGSMASTHSVTVTVNPDPSVSVDAPNSVDEGTAVSVTNSIVGGTGPYNVTLYVNGRPSSSWNITSLLKLGNNSVQAKLVDSAGIAVTSEPKTVTVNKEPQFGFATETRIGDVNLPVSLEASGLYGTQPYNFSWSVNGGAPSYGKSFSFTPNSTGRYTVSLSSSDSAGYNSVVTLNVTVNPSPNLGSYSMEVGDNLLYQGGVVSFAGNVVGGAPPYFYTWYVDGIPYNSSGSSISIGSTGAHSVSLVVEDAVGYKMYASLDVTTSYNLLTFAAVFAIIAVATVLHWASHRRRRRRDTAQRPPTA